MTDENRNEAESLMETAAIEQTRKGLSWEKPALRAAIMFIIALAVIGALGACSSAKPADKVCIPNGETLYAAQYALQTENLDGLAAAMGIFEKADAAGYGCTAIFSTEQGIDGVDLFLYPFDEAAPADSIDDDFAMSMRGACYILLAVTDRLHWARFSTVDDENEAHCWGRACEDAEYDIQKARTDGAAWQSIICAIEKDVESGQVAESFTLTAEGVEVPSNAPVAPWVNMSRNALRSVNAADYGIVYDIEHMPDWDRVTLSYLCAYYLNADGAYAEGAMDTLMNRYREDPDVVLGHIKSLAGQKDPKGRGDASEVLQLDLKQSMEAFYGDTSVPAI